MFALYQRAVQLFQISKGIALEASIRDFGGFGSNNGSASASAAGSNAGFAGSKHGSDQNVFASGSPIEDECWDIWTGHDVSGDCVAHS